MWILISLSVLECCFPCCWNAVSGKNAWGFATLIDLGTSGFFWEHLRWEKSSKLLKQRLDFGWWALKQLSPFSCVTLSRGLFTGFGSAGWQGRDCRATVVIKLSVLLLLLLDPTQSISSACKSDAPEFTFVRSKLRRICSSSALFFFLSFLRTRLCSRRRNLRCCCCNYRRFSCCWCFCCHFWCCCCSCRCFCCCKSKRNFPSLWRRLISSCSISNSFDVVLAIVALFRS